jgi:serine/threonine-protein kinase RsbW
VQLHRDLVPDVRAPCSARRVIEGLEAEIGHDRVDIARLLASELVTNSVKYAGHEPTEPIELKVRIVNGRLHVAVVDRGRGFDVPPEVRRGGMSGFGLLLLRELADQWGIDSSNRTTVWFELDGERGRAS